MGEVNILSVCSHWGEERRREEKREQNNNKKNRPKWELN